MKKYIVLLWLRIKSAFVAFPQIFAGTVLFSAIFGAAAFGMYALESVSGEEELLKVAVVYPAESRFSAENTYTRKAFEVLGQMEGVKKICTFEDYDDEEAARIDLRKGNVAAVVVIPQGFLSSIISGENRPAKVIFKKNSGAMNSDLFMEMIRAGASDLSTAQAGVYALDDVCDLYDIDFYDSVNANVDINARYLSYALNRGEYFETEEVKTGYNNLSTGQIYGSFAIVLVLFISSITCVGLISSDSAEVNQALRVSGIVTGINHCFKVVSVSIVYWIMFGTVYLFAGLAVVRFPKLGKFFTFMGNPDSQSVYDALNENAWSNLFAGILATALLMLVIFAFAGFVFKITDKTISGVLVLFLLITIMIFSSGFVTIGSGLSAVISGLGQFTPLVLSVKLCGQIIAGFIEMKIVMANLLYVIVFFCMSALTDALGEKKRL